MDEIHKEALSLIWRPHESSLIESTNQTLSCINQTARLPYACAYHQSDHSSKLIDPTSVSDALETVFGVNIDPEVIIGLITSNVFYILNKIRLLFYIVWPTEIMFSSLDQVPRYVAEVSRTAEFD